jgi:hypothetical protein
MSDPKSEAIDEVVESWLSLFPGTRKTYCQDLQNLSAKGSPTRRFADALVALSKIHDAENTTHPSPSSVELLSSDQKSKL